MTMTQASRGDAAAEYPIRIDALRVGEYCWRLTASNGRSVARSADVFPDAATATAALDALIVEAAERPLTGSVGHRPGGGWGWTATDRSGRPVAHSPRTFERHGSCARSLQRFRTALIVLSAR